MIVVLIIINFAVITLIWNILQRLYMKITGASIMFFDGKKKLIATIFLSLVLAGAGI